MDAVEEELKEFEKEFGVLEEDHRQYVKKVSEMKSLQTTCLNLVSRYRSRLKKMMDAARSLQKTSGKGTDAYKKIQEVLLKMEDKKASLIAIEDHLPHKNGAYLSVILGQVNVSLLSRSEKISYKQEYEKFKLIVTVITFMWSVFLLAVPSFGSRTMDAGYHFLLVWYYCTLTIRENILIVNGSRIKGWWVTHHFISTLCAGIFLVWPDGVTYQLFRNQFLMFTTYLSIVQVFQYTYQSGILYRLRALGERDEMDVTVEGFQSWMFRGLKYLLPFLFIGYAYQLYNSYVLYHLWYHPRCTEWQVPVLSALFLVLALCNIGTTLAVVRKKFSRQLSSLLLARKKARAFFGNHVKQL